MAREAFVIEIPVSVQDNTEAGTSSATKRLSAFEKAWEKVKKRLERFSKSHWQVRFDLIDRVSGTISKVGTTVKGLTGKAWNFTVGVVDKATAPIRGIFDFVSGVLKNPLVQLGSVLGISVGFKDVVDTFGSFESIMSKVKALSSPTAEQFEQLNAKAKELGATTKFTATEVGEGFSYMAMAGWEADDMIGGISGILSLAAASGEDLATTSDIVTDALTAFGLKAGDATHFADVLAVASSKANTNVSKMGETFKYVATASGTLGYSIEDVALGIGLMANSGIKSSQAGTELNSIFSRLANNTNGARDAIEALGVKFYNSDGSARSFGTVLEELRTKTSKMTAQQRINFASTVAGQRAYTGLLAMLEASQEDYDKLAESIQNADGAAAEMAATMLDNMEGSFILLQSAVDGAKQALGERLSPYLRQFADWLTSKMPKVEVAIGHMMDYADEKIAWLKSTIRDFTSGEDWAKADIWGKIKISWEKIIQEPFSEWWNSSGKSWFSKKMSSLGETLGSGITAGFVALLGISTSDVTAEGKTIGGAFIDGFKEGFDTDEITKALKNWASNNKGTAAAIGTVIGFEIVTGIAGKINTLTQFVKGKTGTGGIGGDPVTTCTTATVNGNIVNVYGKIVNKDTLETGKSAVKMLMEGTGGEAVKQIAGSVIAKTAANAAIEMLTGGTVAGAAAEYTVAIPIAEATGEALVVGTTTNAAVAALGNFAAATGGAASTVGGMAMLGGAEILAIIGGILGLGSAGIDVYQGYNKNKSGDAKGAKDEYVTAGTKASAVAIGAGIGGLIGGPPGALIGAGIGGVVSLLGGNKAGKAISDSTDEGGFLNDAWKSTKTFFKEDVSTFFTKTIPDGWHSFWDGVGSFFTESIPSWWDGLKEKVSSFFTETIPEKWSEFWKSIEIQFTVLLPYVLGYAVGKIEIFFTETLPNAVGNLMEAIGSFFSDVWTWGSDIWNNHIVPFFTETLPEAIGNLWDSISSFFSDVSAWASDIWNEHIVPFFTETLPEAWENLWTEIGTFFTSTLPTWASDVWTNHIVPFFTVDLPNFFDNFWVNLAVFFTITLPIWALNVWNNNIVPFFTTSLPAFFNSFWNNLTTFFTSTLPTWASNVWNNNIVPFFTQTLPGFFSKIWALVTVSFMGALPAIAGAIWSSISSWFSSLTSWLSSVWSRVTASFSAGYGDATGKSGGSSKHAWGGIMNAPHMALVAEDGPEAIIPLSHGKNRRGIDLWEKAGQILGVSSENDAPSSSEKHPAPHLSLVSSKHAWGGIMNTPHTAMVAEDGPEAIIPLSASKNQRGIDLWEQTGRTLGVNPYTEKTSNEDSDGNAAVTTITTNTTGGNRSTEAGNHFEIKVEVNPQFVIDVKNSGMDEDGIVATIKAHIKEMADDIADEIAEKLARAFANMPVKGEVA